MVTKKESNLVSRPRRKADSSVKGKLNRWEGSDYVEFVPTGTRESNRRMLKQLGNSSFYKSEGQKESSYSLHLNVDGESADPVGEMFQQFQLLTQGEQKQKPQMPEGCRGQMLTDNGILKVWMDSENGKLAISFPDGTDEKAGLLMDAMLLGIKQVAEDHDEYVSLNIED